MTEGFALFLGSANPALAEAIAVELGVGVGARRIERFPDGETALRIADHATNIAEDVVYLKEGEIIRHQTGNEPSSVQGRDLPGPMGGAR